MKLQLTRCEKEEEKGKQSRTKGVHKVAEEGGKGGAHQLLAHLSCLGEPRVDLIQEERRMSEIATEEGCDL